jgi:fumarylacetoacetase
MSDETERTFIKNSDTIILRGYCQNDEVRIGFGECKGKIKKSK